MMMEMVVVLIMMMMMVVGVMLMMRLAMLTCCPHKAFHSLSFPGFWRSACTWKAAHPGALLSPSKPTQPPQWSLLARTLYYTFHHNPPKKAHIVSCFEQREELLVSPSLGEIGSAAHFLPRLQALKIEIITTTMSRMVRSRWHLGEGPGVVELLEGVHPLYRGGRPLRLLWLSSPESHLR